MHFRLLPCIAALVCTFAWSSSAHAFRTYGDLVVCEEQGCLGQKLSHPSTTVSFAVLSEHLELSGLSAQQTVAAIQQGLENWTAAPCTSLRLDFFGVQTRELAMGDGHNDIGFKDAQWFETNGIPPEAVLGIAPAEQQLVDGQWQLVEADVFLNGEVIWQIEPSKRDFFEPGTPVGLEDVVTHEGGHFLGVMHPCQFKPSREDPLAPKCDDVWDDHGSLPSLWPIIHHGERTLTPDDERAICYLYPGGCPDETCGEELTCDPERMMCVPPSNPGAIAKLQGGAGCSAAEGGTHNPGGWLLFALGWLALRRRASA